MRLFSIYQILFDRYGQQHWWPGDNAFEIMVGAVLTQNTAWANVERAIDGLRRKQLLNAEGMAACSPEQLAQVIRPSGYFNIKAKRLQSLCHWLIGQGGVAALARYDDASLRQLLLSVHGIGPETADDILLYACQRPVFVIDAYTRRLFSRLALFQGDEAYDDMRLAVQEALSKNTVSSAERVPLFNEYHALIVRHAKIACRKKSPRCDQCCLRVLCPSASVLSSNVV